MSKPEYHFLISIEQYLAAAQEMVQILPSGVQALRRACDAGEMADPFALQDAADQLVPHFHALHNCLHSLDVSMANLHVALSDDVVEPVKAKVAALRVAQHLATADDPSQGI